MRKESGRVHGLLTTKSAGCKWFFDTTLPRMDVLVFSCTSCAVAMGAENMMALLAQARPGIKYTTPAGAGVAALRQFKARKIALHYCAWCRREI